MVIAKHEQFYIHVSLTGLNFTGEIQTPIRTENTSSCLDINHHEKKPVVFEKKSLGVSSLEKKIWLSGELTLTPKED